MTPVMGSKPIFVAFFLMLAGLSTQAPSIETWIAAILATFAVALIGWPSSKSRTSYRGLILALCAAAGFGLLDSLVPHFTHKSDPFNILFCVFGTVGAFSLFLIPWSEGKLTPYRPASDLWMWASAFPMGAQAVLMSMAIGLYRVPTEANVFYSCRGLWAVLLVACIGNTIGLKEGKSHSSIILRRLIGDCTSSWCLANRKVGTRNRTLQYPLRERFALFNTISQHFKHKWVLPKQIRSFNQNILFGTMKTRAYFCQISTLSGMPPW